MGPWAWIDTGSIQDRSRIDPGSIQDRSWLDPGSMKIWDLPLAGSRRDPASRTPPFWGAAEGRRPSFVHLLHCFYMLFACFAFILRFIYIVVASLLGLMRQLLRQWLLPRMLWMMLQHKILQTIHKFTDK